MKVAFVTGSRGRGGCTEFDKQMAKALGVNPVTPFYDADESFVKLKVPFLPRLLARLSKPPIHLFDWFVFSSFEPPDCDVLITSGNWARSIITPEYTVHVNYCHSPWRNLYDLFHHKYKGMNVIKQSIYLSSYEFLRIVDECIDKRVDYYFVNSPVTQKRLKKYLKRDSVVLYPPIDCNKYKFKEYGDFYLYLGRVEPEKRVEEVIRSCIKLRKKLLVAGNGSQLDKLKSKYGDKVDFLGFVSEKEKIELLSECKAVFYPSIGEAFGIVPVEALASGKPVIVGNDGFPNILIKKCGYGVVTDGTVEGLTNAIKIIEKTEYDSDEIIKFSRDFDFEKFKGRLWYWLKKFRRDYHADSRCRLW